MNKLTTAITLSALLVSGFASAKCVLDGEWIKTVAFNATASQAEKKELPSVDCEISKGYFIRDLSPKSEFARVTLDLDKFSIGLYAQPNIDVLDLTDLDSGYQYSIDVIGSTNLEEIKLGKIEQLGQLMLDKTKITDLRFLEDVTVGDITLKQKYRMKGKKVSQKIKYFPSKDSQFCETIREETTISISPNDTRDDIFEACGKETK